MRAAGLLSLALLGSAGPSQAASAPPAEGLPNVDRREAVQIPAPAPTRTARRALAADLGPLGEVRTDRESGGVSYVGSSDGLLTGRSSRRPREIALDYVRTHRAAFGLGERDIAQLQLVARSVSPDGITHLRFNQTLDGIWSFDSGIDAHVTADGRLINVSGTPVPGARLPDPDPALSARAGLREARKAIDGPTRLPATTKAHPTPERTTTFAGGEQAVLRWTPSPAGPRLAWSVIADDGDGRSYDVLVDAENGDLLRRQNLTSHLGEAQYFQADPLRTPTPKPITMPSAWYDEHDGGTRLWGQYAHTYVDPDYDDVDPNAEISSTHVQIPASAGAPATPDWLYAQSTAFPDPRGGCPESGCTWEFSDPASSEDNQFQAATNAHVLVSGFHNYLLQAPIGFDEASGNFQRTNSSGEGLGNDYVRVEVNDGSGYDNANFSTPPDGTPGRMQMYLYKRNGRNVNGSDAADVVYHEYTHGLSNRLIVNASGSSALTSFQSRMMGEGWSDFYSLDLLAHQGAIPDTAAPGELARGIYTSGPPGSRMKPIDCPVDPAGPTAACNGPSAAPVRGGFTYGDIVDLYRRQGSPLAWWYNESPHDGGEVWGETLWDIRTALGRNAALALITGGMRLSVDGPSMLDMRDAILQQAVATRSAPGAADDYYDRLWEVFRRRGMGADASVQGAGSTTPIEGFGLVTAADPAVLTDPYPGGDNDGVIDPGEQFTIGQKLRSVVSGDVASFTGTLTGGAGATVVDATATWPLLGGGQTVTNSDPLAARLPTGCTRVVPLTLSLATATGPSKVRIALDPRPGSSATVALADATGAGPGVTTTSINVTGSGTVTDVDLRIDELRHKRLGDLKIELLHAGKTAVLFDRFPWLGQDVFDLIFDAQGTALLPTFDPSPMTGRIQPYPATSALNVFNGHPVAGSWTLRITDFVEGSAGTLRGWGIDSPQQDCGGHLEIPVAQSDAASEVEQRTATVSGAVTPNGRETGLRFAFGTTAAYGATSDVISVGSGNAPVGTSIQLTGLEPGTTYHYRFEAIREGGQVAVASADRAFTTASPPGPPIVDPPVIDPPPGDPPGLDPPVFDPPRFDPPVINPPVSNPPGSNPPVSNPRPKISQARVKLTRAGKRKHRRRASFSFRVSEPAKVTTVVTRTASGIRKGKRCVAVPKRRPRTAKSCKRQVSAAKKTVRLRTSRRGTLRLPAAGLRKGRYTAKLTAVDADRQRSKPVVVRFRVK